MKVLSPPHNLKHLVVAVQCITIKLHPSYTCIPSPKPPILNTTDVEIKDFRIQDSSCHSFPKYWNLIIRLQLSSHLRLNNFWMPCQMVYKNSHQCSTAHVTNSGPGEPNVLQMLVSPCSHYMIPLIC